MSRHLPTVLTAFDVRKICDETSSSIYSQSGAISSLRPQFSDVLAGREFCFSFDNGEILRYRFKKQSVEWSSGEDFSEEYAECLESDCKNVFLVHHLRTNTTPYNAVTLIIDLGNSLVTMIDMKLGTIHATRDVLREVRFGFIGEKDAAGNSAAHTFTDDLTGTVIDWKFSNDMMIHQMYENISCCAFVSPPPESAPEWNEFFITFNPTKYVKIREKLYMISFCAPGSSGMEGDMLMDLEHMTCVGSVFGIDNKDSLRSYTFGGRGAYADVAFVGHYTVE